MFVALNVVEWRVGGVEGLLQGSHLSSWSLKEGGVDAVVMAVYNLADTIMGYLGGERFGFEVLFSVEGEPLGAGLLIMGGL